MFIEALATLKRKYLHKTLYNQCSSQIHKPIQGFQNDGRDHRFYRSCRFYHLHFKSVVFDIAW